MLGEVSARGPGEYEYNPDCRFVRCPWHGWEYNLETGQSSYDPEHDRVRAYPVSVQRGADLVPEPGGSGENGEGAEGGNTGGRRPGPYVVETFEVSVRDDYVVLEI